MGDSLQLMKQRFSAPCVSTRLGVFLLKLLVLLGLMCTPMYQGYPAVAVHHFDCNGTEVDDSVGSAAGSLINSANVSSGVISLNGAGDYVQFENGLVPAGTNFSVAFFMTEAVPGVGPSVMLSQAQGFTIGLDSSHMVSVGANWATGVPFPLDGAAHHLALTSDASQAVLFLDGIAAATNTS